MPPDSSFCPRDWVRITNGDSRGMRGVIVGPGIIPFDGITTWKVAVGAPHYVRTIREDFLEHAPEAT